MMLAAFLISMLGAALAHYPGDHTPQAARWCCISDAELAKCHALARAASAVTNISVTMNVTCVRGANVTDCMSRICSDKADLVTLGETDIYKAGKLCGLLPVVAEDYGLAEKQTSYFAVALVLDSTSPSLNMTSLKGAVTCHPRANDVAGWQVPMGFLIQNKLMEWKDCSAYKAAGAFFEKSCVPGAFLRENDPDSDNPRNLCGACSRESCPCDNSERFYGYNGTYTCLVEKHCHVAFVRHTTVFEYTGVSNDLNPGWDFKLLCPDGTRKGVGYYEECNLARIPARVVVSRDWAPDWFRLRGYRSFLLELDTWLRQNKTLFNMYNSSYYNGKDLLFKDSTVGLTDIGDKNTTEKWLGESYLGIVRALDSCVPKVEVASRRTSGQRRLDGVRWLVIGVLAVVNIMLMRTTS